MKTVGFYTNKKKRVRPITPRKRWRPVRAKLDIRGADVQKDTVKVAVPDKQGKEVEREYALMRHPSPYAKLEGKTEAEPVNIVHVKYESGLIDPRKGKGSYGEAAPAFGATPSFHFNQSTN